MPAKLRINFAGIKFFISKIPLKYRVFTHYLHFAKCTLAFFFKKVLTKP